MQHVQLYDSDIVCRRRSGTPGTHARTPAGTRPRRMLVLLIAELPRNEFMFHSPPTVSHVLNTHNYNAYARDLTEQQRARADVRGV